MVHMIDVDDFRDLCGKHTDEVNYAKENENKYLIMKNYSVESRVSSRVALGALSFSIGYCMCTIGQYPLSITELQLLMLGAPAAVSLLGCDVLEIGCRKSYKNLTAAKTWYNKISEQAYYKIQMITANRKGEAYYKTIERLEEADFEFDLDFFSMSKEECKLKLKELEQQATEAEEKVELYAFKEALISEFGKKASAINFGLGFGYAVVGAGFFSALVDTLPSLVNESLYSSSLDTGINPVIVSSITAGMFGAYQINKFIKNRKALRDFDSGLGEESVFHKDERLDEKVSAAVDRMADVNLSLLLYKGYMKSLENCEEINKKLVKIQELDS